MLVMVIIMTFINMIIMIVNIITDITTIINMNFCYDDFKQQLKRDSDKKEIGGVA